MKRLSEHPYYYFFVSAIFIFLLGVELFKYGYLLDKSDVVFNIFDTYFVISNFDFHKGIAFLFGLIGFIYLYIYTWDIFLNRLLVNIHTVTSIGCFVIYCVGRFYFAITNTERFPLFDNGFSENSFNVLTFALLIFIQVIFILNLIIGLIKTVNKKRK